MRLDQALVARNLCASREQAKRLILSGAVRRNGQILTKPNAPVSPDDVLEVTEQPRYVSRGGLKLEAALDAFRIDPAGKICLDIGASTGGFTDCLLQRGAARVYAFDSGKHQLAAALRADPRVVSRENFNARHLQPGDIGEPVQLIVIDVSFISLTLILPAAARVLEKDGDLVALIKPQFELSREQIGKGGIVRDANLHRAAVEKIQKFATQELSLDWRGVIASPVTGGDGNQEFLAWIKK